MDQWILGVSDRDVSKSFWRTCVIWIYSLQYVINLFTLGIQLGMNIQLYQLIECENLYVDS